MKSYILIVLYFPYVLIKLTVIIQKYELLSQLSNST